MWEQRKQIYTDIYQLHKKYLGTQDFEGFVKEQAAIYRKYNSTFCKELLMAVAEDINRYDTGSKT